MDGQVDFKGNEILQQPFPPIGSFICVTAKHMTEEDWDVLSKYFHLIVPMSNEQRDAVSRVTQKGGGQFVVFDKGAKNAPAVYVKFMDNNAFTPSRQSGGNFVNPEFEIYMSSDEEFECVEGDGHTDLKTSKKLIWHNVSLNAKKKIMKPYYDGAAPKYVDSIVNEAGIWKRFTWDCGYNISVRVKNERTS